MDVINSKIEQVKAGANQAVNQVTTQASQIVSGLTDKLKASALTGSDILGASPSIGKYIFGSVGSLFQEANAALNSTLSNFTQDTKNLLQKNFNDIPKTLGVFGSGNLSSKGLGFIASTTSKAIEGIDLPGIESVNSFANMGVGQLSRLASMGSEVLNSGKNAFNAVTKGIQTAKSLGTNIVNNVTGMISGNVNTILEPVTKIATPISTLLNGYSVANIISSNLDFLPSSIRNYVSGVAGSSVSSATANALNSIGSIVGINNLAGATSTASNILSNYGNRYYNQADANGNYVNGFSSYNGDVSNFNTLVNLANSLCTSIGGNIPTIDYSTNKNLYDMLIQLACELGLGGIADMLLNCFDTDTLYDSRTRQILGDVANTAARKGDSYSVNLSLKYANGYVGKQKEVLTTLISNSSYSESNKKNISDALYNSNLAMSDLVTNAFFYSGTKTRNKSVTPVVYDAEMITVMQASCTNYVDEAITKEDRNLVNNVYNLWGNKEGNA